MKELAPDAQFDEAAALEKALHTAVAASDGDHHATIRALLVSNTYLRNEVERLRDLISSGFMRSC